ncbi:MAG: methyltransferase domain-containing protein [Anaerolineales bacterium]
MEISRVKRSKSDAKISYDHMSGIYDLLAGSSEGPLMCKGLEMLGVQPGEKVLEIGTGTGKAQIELCQQVGEKGLVYGMDLSTGMLRVARNNLAKAGFANRIHLLSGDGAWLPYASASFTAVFMSFTLELFDTPEIPQVLGECWRVLKPGGRLGVVAMQQSEHPGWMLRLYEWFHEKLPNYVDCRPIDAGSMVQEAGFILEKLQSRSMWGLPVQILLTKKNRDYITT